MSINTLGHSKNLDRYWSGGEFNLADGGELDITDVDQEFVESIDEVANYPYDNQIIIKGSFEYHMPTYDDSEPYAPGGTFEYRTSSGLFLVDTDTTRPNHEEVISAINKGVSKDAEIEDALSISRERLWQFLSEADSVDPLSIRGKDGSYNANDLLMVLRSADDDAFETLKELHETGQIQNYHVLKRVLNKMTSTEDIETLSDIDLDLYRNRISYAEADFEYNHDFATVIYDNGSITIDPMDDTVREYVLQLIERELIS